VLPRSSLCSCPALEFAPRPRRRNRSGSEAEHLDGIRGIAGQMAKPEMKKTRRANGGPVRGPGLGGRRVETRAAEEAVQSFHRMLGGATMTRRVATKDAGDADPGRQVMNVGVRLRRTWARRRTGAFFKFASKTNRRKKLVGRGPATAKKRPSLGGGQNERKLFNGGWAFAWGEQGRPKRRLKRKGPVKLSLLARTKIRKPPADSDVIVLGPPTRDYRPLIKDRGRKKKPRRGTVLQYLRGQGVPTWKQLARPQKEGTTTLPPRGESSKPFSRSRVSSYLWNIKFAEKREDLA